MVMMPKRVKYRKAQRGRRKGLSKGATRICFGEFGLQALGNSWVTNKQIEAITHKEVFRLDGSGLSEAWSCGGKSLICMVV